MTPVRKTAAFKLSLESAMSSSNRVSHRAATHGHTLGHSLDVLREIGHRPPAWDLPAGSSWMLGSCDFFDSCRTQMSHGS